MMFKPNMHFFFRQYDGTKVAVPGIAVGGVTSRRLVVLVGGASYTARIVEEH